MRNIDVCLSPDMIHLYDLPGKIVIIVDVLRATSCMVVGIDNGVASILPVADLEKCRMYKKEGYIIAGERNGEKVEGFDMGNSPFEYQQSTLINKQIAVTTTNGTMAIEKAAGASIVIIGSFLNKSTVARYILQRPEDVVILCAGWKGKFNLEDTLFAGALIEAVSSGITPACDAPLAAQFLYQQSKGNLNAFLDESSHVKRLKNLHIQKDIDYCLQEDIIDVLPVLKDHKVIKNQ